MDDHVGPLAVAKSPRIQKPNNAAANARFAQEAGLRRAVTLQPRTTYRPAPEPNPASASAGTPEPKVTSADVLEALHQTTKLPIVSDYHTRLFPLAVVALRNRPLFETLNQLADTMRMRWVKEGEWLQFRSTSYYDDRLKEVPNRLLLRWAASRRALGALTLEDLLEIAHLSDAQLDGEDMAEGARLCYGLVEWDLARSRVQRPHLHYLASFTPAQREEATRASGLPFTKMTLAQQQKFISYALGNLDGLLQSLDELAGATLRVDYTVPGWYEWRVGRPDALQWVVPLEPGPEGRRALRGPVRERTREATLEAVRRFDPKLREALTQAVSAADPRQAAARPEDAEIVPTQLALTIVYIPGLSNRLPLHILRASQDLTSGTGRRPPARPAAEGQKAVGSRQ
jgi:hypothetical protein